MTVNINGININYIDEGEGSPILMLHGWGSSVIVWKSVINNLKNGFRTIALDFPGCGESELPKNPLSLTDYENLVLEFIEKLNLNKKELIIMGHSHGGRVALSLMGKKLLTPKKAVLFGAAGIVNKKSFKTRAKIRTYKIVKGALSLPFIKNYTSSAIEKAKKHFGSADYSNSPEVMRKTMVMVVSVDIRENLKNIDCPVLLIWGENDTDTPLKNAKLIESLIKDCGLCVLSGVGHFGFVQKPNQTNAILNSFLR